MTRLNISDIQHFCTGDGPGIRTTVFLKGCNQHCPWCHNPETLSAAPQTLRFAASGKVVRYGRQLSVGQVLAPVLEDRPFYIDGGGLTVSGGEPLLQPDGVVALAAAARAEGVDTLVETAGDAPWQHVCQVAAAVKGFLYDWKLPRPADYAAVTGGDGARIYENLCRLLAAGVWVRVRVPLVPGVNTDDADCAAMAALLTAAGAKQVDLLPFHRLGSAKYRALGRAYPYADTAPLSRAAVERIRALYAPHFSVRVEGQA